MRRISLLAATTTLIALLPGPAAGAGRVDDAGPSAVLPEPAGEARVTMMFDVAPGEVSRGSRVVLRGRAGNGDEGNAGPVDLYFRRSAAEPWARAGTTTASGAGHFSATLTASESGDYQAVYRGNKTRGAAVASDYLAVFTTRLVTRMLFTWSGTRLQCRPACTATGPAQALGPGPVKVVFRRSCRQPGSGGSIGFAADPAAARIPGDPAWRDFPDGAGPTEFDLTPAASSGRFRLTWLSTPGADTTCDLSFSAAQRSTEKLYL
ncbi:hypothetical protein [Actinoplanes sp. NBRC 101535]|uniref:hypothetical protein n=1 Tax=Actinoplanes sp. NBRC 101535 TaxID=3032196 RepID=UPI0024A20769|nr:hypothetical protein [Actinoplanes sp. NBRC 101535]GLY00041.1 hypothetical protein Acsp01_04200 [Actinoplanes sp. NBRC 101535]